MREHLGPLFFCGGNLARINVDNEFLCDPRLQLLCKRMERWEAIGAVISLWEIGQCYWKKSKSLIPPEIYALLHRSKELIECKFVEPKAGGFYCKGAEERWGFLLAQSKSGKASAAARRAKYGTATPIHASNFPPNETPNETERHPERTPNETEHSSSSSSCNKETHTSASAERHLLLDLWNQHSPPLPTVREFSKKRKAAARARWREKPEPEYWAEVVQRIATSDFCRGGGATGWKANFDWFLKPDTHIRVSEGTYDDKKKHKNQPELRW